MSAPKKAAKKAAPKHDEGKDLRRAHEHQGRVIALSSALGERAGEINTLTALAEQEAASSHFSDAADLFRAAEHLSFGMLASTEPVNQRDSRLAASVTSEFQNKLEKAQEHWEDTEPLDAIYQKALAGAQKAFDEGAYRKALELVRAAEALAHVHLHEQTAEEAAA